jgi:hypothetical protein
MIRLRKTWITNSALAMTLVTPVGAFAFQAKDVPGKSGAMPGPSDEAIAAAKARGLVWVDPSTKVYYKGGQFYGKTRRGEFMPEDVAKKDGNREEKPMGGKK